MQVSCLPRHSWILPPLQSLPDLARNRLLLQQLSQLGWHQRANAGHTCPPYSRRSWGFNGKQVYTMLHLQAQSMAVRCKTGMH